MNASRPRTTISDRPGGAYHQVSTSGLRARAERRQSGTVARRSEPARAHRRAVLADTVTRALAARQYGVATASMRELMALEPHEPRWHLKYGEVLRTLGRDREAAGAYRRAARRYEALELKVHASAALRVADQLDGGDSSAQFEQRSSDRVAKRREQAFEARTTSRPPPA